MDGGDPRTENERLIREGYEAFGRVDLAAVEQIFLPDATWHAQRLGVLSGDYVGWPAVVQFFGRTMELTGGTFTVTIEDVLTNETGAAVVVRSRGSREGARSTPGRCTCTGSEKVASRRLGSSPPAMRTSSGPSALRVLLADGAPARADDEP